MRTFCFGIGTGRKKINLPDEDNYNYGKPDFFLVDENGNIKIIYETMKRDSDVCKCTKDLDCLTHPGGDYCDVETGECVTQLPTLSLWQRIVDWFKKVFS